jgi:fatty acid desaturase
LFWSHAGITARIGLFAALALAICYGILVIGHLFTHYPWFQLYGMNSIAGVLVSLNMGQSAQAYTLTHERNHHRYNNDRQGQDGITLDTSSTFRGAPDGDHVGLFRYAFGGAILTLISEAKTRVAVFRLWRVGARESNLLDLCVRHPERRARELRQIQIERAALAFALLLALALSPGWLLTTYIPALFFALALVNVQNYYEHFGARPEDRYANSISYYGWLYNLLTFNDGYHQEHHLRPRSHWSELKTVRRHYAHRFAGRTRIVSPVPAILGFLHLRRARLDRGTMMAWTPRSSGAVGFPRPDGEQP